jgi:hypothetical protein
LTDQTAWIATPITGDLVRGTLELEQTPHGLLPHRLPAWARRQWVEPQLAMAESQPSGVRLAFASSATAIELDVLATKRVYAGLPPRPDGVYDLYVDGQLVEQASVSGGRVVQMNLATGSMTTEDGAVGTMRFGNLASGKKVIELWLPHNETTELVALRSNAPVVALGTRGRRVWLHHGSSISQGSNAASGSGIWPAVAAMAGGVDLTNLGFGGSALLDPFTARAMRDTPADLISVKLGINLVNLDLMRLRAFGPAVHGFLDTIREGHPSAPLLVVSPLYCPIHEQTPGPGAVDFSTGALQFRATGRPEEVAAGKLTLEVIRATLQQIVAQRAATDPHMHYLDGLALYGTADQAALPLPDGLHPDGETHRLIGERFAAQAFAETGPFGGAVAAGRRL